MKGHELLKEKNPVKEVDGSSDKLSAKELSCADSNIAGKKFLAQTYSLHGHVSGVSLIEKDQQWK